MKRYKVRLGFRDDLILLVLYHTPGFDLRTWMTIALETYILYDKKCVVTTPEIPEAIEISPAAIDFSFRNEEVVKWLEGINKGDVSRTIKSIFLTCLDRPYVAPFLKSVQVTRIPKKKRYVTPARPVNEPNKVKPTDKLDYTKPAANSSSSVGTRKQYRSEKTTRQDVNADRLQTKPKPKKSIFDEDFFSK